MVTMTMETKDKDKTILEVKVETKLIMKLISKEEILVVIDPSNLRSPN